MRRLLAACVLVLAFSGAAFADDWGDCNRSETNPDLSVRGCTNIIVGGRDSREYLAIAYNNRGNAYDYKGDHDRAIADFDMAIQLQPDFNMAYNDRGDTYTEKGDYDRAIADLDMAIRLNPASGYAYNGRGEAYYLKGDPTKALTDFRIAAQLIPASDHWRGTALARIGELEKNLAAVAPTPQVSPPSQKPAVEPPSVAVLTADLGPRVALVIGNSAYSAIGELANAQHDAEAIASALASDGFKVTEADNVNRAGFIAALNQFSDAAAKADWAIVYFAGHGLQLDGVNYVIPVDAKLVADRDVPDEGIPLDRVIAAVNGVQKFGLIIVDACRNNPFLAGMRFTGVFRAARTRGLAHIEVHGTTLVEFSAGDGQMALDGDDPAGNSPFAAALAKLLATPGLEVGMLLRQIRVDVLAATANQQEPMFSGNIPAEVLFFRPPK